MLGVFVIRQTEFGEATFDDAFFRGNITCRENDVLGSNKCTGQSKANLPRCQRPHDVQSSFPRHLILFKGRGTPEPVRRAVSPEHMLTSEEPKMSTEKISLESPCVSLPILPIRDWGIAVLQRKASWWSTYSLWRCLGATPCDWMFTGLGTTSQRKNLVFLTPLPLFRKGEWKAIMCRGRYFPVEKR